MKRSDRRRPGKQAGPEPFPGGFRAMLPALASMVPRLRDQQLAEKRSRKPRPDPAGGLFAGHREYRRGDDLRLLDWNAYARTGELHIKQLEEELRGGPLILLDCTGSMAAGEPMRLLGAARLAAVLGAVALHRSGVCHLLPMGGAEDVGRVSSYDGPAALPRLLGDLRDALDRGPAGELPDPGALLGASDRAARGPVVWVSDFADPEPSGVLLRALRSAGRRVGGWLPQLPEERGKPPAGGWTRWLCPETGRELIQPVDRELAQAFAAEYRHHAALQDRVFGQVGASLRRFQVPAVDDHSIAAWAPAVLGNLGLVG